MLFRSEDISWSPDGSYLATAGEPQSGDSAQLFSFDRSTGALTKVDGVTAGIDYALGVSFSPDGKYLAVGFDTSFGSDDDTAIIYQALTFPSSNVIKNNIVHCASGNSSTDLGVGISGSSIENLIVANTSYDNASFNYLFVANVFNQLFTESPSFLQNMSIVSQVPLYTAQPAVPAIAPNGVRNLRQKNVYSGDITLLLAGSYALAEDITADITISVDYVVLDLGGHSLTGSITISSDEVTIKNGTILPTAAGGSDGITVTSASDRTEIHDVTIRCADQSSSGAGLNGIFLNGNDWEIYNCTVIAGAGSGAGNDGGDAILTGTFSNNIAIHDCILYGADGGDSSSSSAAGNGGHGVHVNGGATQIEITNCTVFKAGDGGANSSSGDGGDGGNGVYMTAGTIEIDIANCTILKTGDGGTSSSGTGGDGGHGVNIPSGCVDVSVHKCMIRNTGAAGSGSPSGTGGKAILDAVAAGGTESKIFGNVAHNIANAIKFDLQASGVEEGWQLLSPPDSTAVSKYANVYVRA